MTTITALLQRLLPARHDLTPAADPLQADSLLALILNHLPVGVWITDAEGNIVAGNQAGQRIWAGARYVGVDEFGEYKGWWPETGRRIEAHEWPLARAITHGETDLDRIIDIECFDGSRKTILNSALPIRHESGTILGAIVVNEDITELTRKERQLRDERDFMDAVLNTVGAIVVVMDRAGRVLRFNRHAEEMTGFRADEIIGSAIWDHLIPPEEVANVRAVFERLTAGQFPNAHENAWLCRDGGRRLLNWSNTCLTDSDGSVRHIIGTGIDITERLAAERHMRHLSEHDVLTGLPNRTLLNDRLQQAIAHARRAGTELALLFIDLDHFKNINDSLGHDVGDRVLRMVAERLSAHVRQTDTVSRQGGDEFIVLLTDVEHEETIARVAEKMLEEVARPCIVDGRPLHVTPSIGISVFPGDGDDVNGLVRAADTAMYQAKENGRNTYQFFTADMNARAFERLMLENSLRQALARDEFVLHYQPQVSIADGRIIGMEALIRWRHPELGLVPPARFIPIAEECGLIQAIGDWVLYEACRQNAAWQAEGLPAVPVAVNLSAIDFRRRELRRLIESTLDRHGLKARYLEIEITESILVRDDDNVGAILNGLAQRGVQIAIDDFGTGYSSLAYLKHFPITRLKIDQSFVRDVDTDPDDAAIVNAIIAMTRSLRMEVIAEGVENAAQLAFLERNGCHAAQGFHFSRPLPAQEMGRLLRQGRIEIQRP